MRRRVGDRAATPCITPTLKACSTLCYGVGRFCQLQSWGFSPGEEQIESNWLSPHTATLRGSIWNADCGQGFVLMQIMTQITLVNSARGTLKANRNSTSFNLCLD